MRHAAAALLALAGTLWPTAAASTDVCTISDARATELSGLVSTETGYVVVNDGQPDPDATLVIYLDRRCRLTRTVRYPTPARDPEDLAVAPDGTLWVADTGDNLTSQVRRATIALWHLPASGGSPEIHRLTYPDGPHDAEALLFTGAGAPVVITKELGRPAGLYLPTGPLRAGPAGAVPLRRVGEITVSGPAEAGPLGGMITGAATSPDRRRVAVRTYAAAYEWDVTGGDVVAAITGGSPRATGLPGEPQGEAIAYTRDGTGLLTVSDVAGPTEIRRYRAAPTTRPGAGQVASARTTGPSRPSIPTRYGLAAAVVGLVVAAAGLAGLRRARRPPVRHRVPGRPNRH